MNAYVNMNLQNKLGIFFPKYSFLSTTFFGSTIFSQLFPEYF